MYIFARHEILHVLHAHWVLDKKHGLFHEVVDPSTGIAIGAGGASLGSTLGLKVSLVGVGISSMENNVIQIKLLVVHYTYIIRK